MTIYFLYDAFFVFGGNSDNSDIKTIGRMDIHGHWTKAGELLEKRYGHSTIFDGEYFIIVGGGGDVGNFEKTYTHKSEKCSYDDKKITCAAQSPTLVDYYFYPAVFLVPDTYCKH